MSCQSPGLCFTLGQSVDQAGWWTTRDVKLQPGSDAANSKAAFECEKEFDPSLSYTHVQKWNKKNNHSECFILFDILYLSQKSPYIYWHSGTATQIMNETKEKHIVRDALNGYMCILIVLVLVLWIQVAAIWIRGLVFLSWNRNRLSKSRSKKERYVQNRQKTQWKVVMSYKKGVEDKRLGGDSLRNCRRYHL